MYRPGIVLLLGAAGFALSASTAHALPDPNKPIDTSKRATISTDNALQPSATPVQGNGFVGGRVIRMSEIPIQRASISSDQRADGIVVSETRQKNVTIPKGREIAVVRNQRVQRAGDLPASIPRIDPERYRKMLVEYQKGRVPADHMRDAMMQVGRERVSLADINRFADPRAALEAQGIPVTTAGSGEAEKSTETPVPVPAEKNNGNGSK